MSILPETRHSLLIRLTSQSDLDAWNEFTGIYQRAIFQYARARGLQESDAWEVVQQVLILVHQKIHAWQPGRTPGAFRAWLMRTSHRVCLQTFRDMARRTRAMERVVREHRPVEFQELDNDDDESDRARWALCYASEIVRREVAANTWEAFWSTAVANLSPSSVAGQLGMKVGAVYTAKCRVLARIRELSEELLEVENEI